MRRRLLTLATAIAVALAMAIPVGAAELHGAHQGTECADGFLRLHFVNNQIAGDNDVVLFVQFDNGTVGPLAPDHTTQGTNHWTISAEQSSVLINAWTEGPGGVDGVGKLVLSDFECDEKKHHDDDDKKHHDDDDKKEEEEEHKK